MWLVGTSDGRLLLLSGLSLHTLAEAQLSMPPRSEDDVATGHVVCLSSLAVSHAAPDKPATIAVGFSDGSVCVHTPEEAFGDITWAALSAT